LKRSHTGRNPRLSDLNPHNPHSLNPDTPLHMSAHCRTLHTEDRTCTRTHTREFTLSSSPSALGVFKGLSERESARAREREGASERERLGEREREGAKERERERDRERESEREREH
jgi:hypothetical protein